MENRDTSASERYSYPMVHYQVDHRTSFQYAFPASLSYHSAHLEPINHTGTQQVSGFQLDIQPSPRDLTRRTDYFGNRVHFFSIQEFHQNLEVRASSLVSVIAAQPPVDELTISCAHVKRALHGSTSPDILDALQFIYPSSLTPEVPEISSFARPFFPDNRPFLQGVIELSSALKSLLVFDPKATDLSTPLQEVFSNRRGVCQDFAHLMLACLRSCDLPARYVSGYILTTPPPGQPRLEGADASHAWVSVYVPGFGWIDIDPTNDLLVHDQHIRVAVGRDFNEVSMLKGAVTGGGESELKVEVTVVPLDAADSR